MRIVLAKLMPVAAFGMVAIAMAGETGGPESAPAGPRTVWDGVFSQAQLERGEGLYAANCSVCHGAEKRGGGGIPGVVGPEFRFNWDRRSLSEVLEYIRSTMPPGQAGTLNVEQYVDVLAAILAGNGFPAGAADTAVTPQDYLQIVFLKDRP